MSEQSIELDCAPGNPRPDSYIAEVIEGTGLPAREPCSKFFGNWRWDYSDIDSAVYVAAQPILKERITALYTKRRIRYGSW